jgi:hypothetical protein
MGDVRFVPAVGAPNLRKLFLQITALEKGGHRLLDGRPPLVIPGLIALVGDPPWLDTSGDHGRNREV